MPVILGVGPADPDGSGFTIRFTIPSTPLRAGDLTVRRTDIPGNVRNKALPVIEAWIDQWLQDRLSAIVAVPDDPNFGQRMWEMHAKSSVRSSNPLLVDIIVSQEPIV